MCEFRLSHHLTLQLPDKKSEVLITDTSDFHFYKILNQLIFFAFCFKIRSKISSSLSFEQATLNLLY